MRGEIPSLRGSIIGLLILIAFAIAISYVPKAERKVDDGTVQFPSDKELDSLELDL